MCVKLDTWIVSAIKRCAVPAHRIGERALEKIVVTNGNLLQCDGKVIALCALELL